jgi:hypothetical protein
MAVLENSVLSLKPFSAFSENGPGCGKEVWIPILSLPQANLPFSNPAV